VPDLNSLLPSFDGVPRWPVGGAPAENDLAGKAVLVHFFSSGCPLCTEGMPVVHRVREAFAPSDLVVIGVYQPRPEPKATEGEAEQVVCREPVTNRPIIHIVNGAHRCALDVEGVLAVRFGHQWAPSYFVFDRAHRLRHFQEGNWNLDALHEIIQRYV
jgi:thiol-disulfide isomerase/thioredoxin